jgi:hypothetical protein
MIRVLRKVIRRRRPPASQPFAEILAHSEEAWHARLRKAGGPP